MDEYDPQRSRVIGEILGKNRKKYIIFRDLYSSTTAVTLSSAKTLPILT